MKWLAFEVILLLFLSNSITAQESFAVAEEVYGPHPLLYNGRKYSFYVSAETDGSQYLTGPAFLAGTVAIKGIDFDAAQLNYDIYNQEIVMKYETEAGATNLLRLSQAWIGSFTLEDMHFELLALPGTPNRIYQVLGTGELRILYHWKKTLDLDIGYGSRKYVFSQPTRESYLQTGGQFVSYKNNRSFIAAFDPGKQAEIRKYMKARHINVKKAGDAELTGLMNHCESLVK